MSANVYHHSTVSVDQLNARAAGRLAGLMGIEFLSVEKGRLTSHLIIRPELMAANGYLHSATVIALADSTAGFGTITHLPDGESNFTTLELKTNFLGSARDGRILCEARAAHLGRTTHVWDATVTTPEGKTLALFRCTQMLLSPK
jgi:uncharacterized protein (TIGR00369 family)